MLKRGGPRVRKITFLEDLKKNNITWFISGSQFNSLTHLTEIQCDYDIYLT